MFEAMTYEAVLADIMSRAPDGIDLRQGSIFTMPFLVSRLRLRNITQTLSRYLI